MKFILKLIWVVVPTVLFVACSSPKSLFGENESKWLISGDANWNHENGALLGKIENGTGFIMTNDQFDNFELTLDFKPDRNINSGVFIRCQEKEISASECYEINIWDLNPNQDYRTGGVVDKSKPINYVETIEKWNHYKIIMVDQHLQVFLNGIRTTDIQDDSLKRGYIGLQAKGSGEIEFKNVRIKNIE